MQRTITLSLFALSALLTFAAAKPYAPYAPNISPRSSDAQHLTHEKRVTHSGEVTYFTPASVACGGKANANDAVVAISSSMYGSGDNCGQWVEITNPSNGKSVYAEMRDRCSSQDCPGKYDIAITVPLYEDIGALELPNFPVEWHFKAKGWHP